MKKLIVASVLAAASAAFADMKVGTVDLLLLVRNHPNYDSNKELVTTTEKDYQKKLEGLKGELERLQEEGKKISDQMRNPMLAENAKKKLEKDLTDIQTKFMQGQQKLRSEAMRSQQDLQELEGRLLKTTTADLRKRVAKYAEANGYDFIFDSNAAPYSKKAYDVSNEILKGMGVDPKDAKGKEKNEGK